jgi:tetratricopeptide (TPR) repeat protein
MSAKTRIVLGAGFLALLLNSGYLSAFPEPNLFYVGNVLLHLSLGAALFLIWLRLRFLVAVIGLAGLTGLALAVAGATRPHWWLVALHVTAGLAAALAIGLRWRSNPRFFRPFVAFASLALLLPATAWIGNRFFPNPTHRIVNPKVVPVSMNEEGDGPSSPFFPSSSTTNTGKIIPSEFFMDSEACKECHQDIYDQWNSSVHHFGSFNNQFYRKSIEYMQDVIGTKPSKWCAGCHDHAVFFNGRFERPIKEQIDTPAAHTGLGCMSCHSITRVNDTMGNAGFTIEYPPLHELATSKNRVVRALHNYLIKTAPEPHRRAFLKPFMRQDASEFCGTCHKVHLDVPVNDYRWVRGFNEYDAWQASAASGYGARSFYYPAQPSTCVDCHMPLTPSQDLGQHGGQVHSHRFPAANTAVPFVNHDAEQLKITEAFLKDNIVSVDIFAATPVEADLGAPPMRRRASDAPIAASTFAVGEEAEAPGQIFIREVSRVAAPLDQAAPSFRPGETVRVDVVVRTRKVGHFFPGGTVDSFDVWLELKGADRDGRVIFWSGRLEDEGRGPVESGAHFYRSYQLDAEGHPINKRNAWQTRSVLYVRLIPPSSADVAHYRVRIPPDAKGPIQLTARLNYRKFAHYYTQFSYAGRPDPTDPAKFGPAFDNRRFLFSPAGIPANVSGQIKGRIPDLPIVTVASAQASLKVGPEPTVWQPVVRKQDRERWNDWGIGLLLQGDLRGAEYAFLKTTAAEPEYADGWLNVARAYVQEGQTDAAKPFLAKALTLNSKLARAHYFQALVEKADGDYDAALRSLRTVEAQYPRDRVVLNQIARILFLQRDYRGALAALDRVQAVDPEDLQMHYSKMLCYRGLGQADAAAREEQLFRRFKADESAQEITARPRRASAEDNNERQMIHDHESVNFGPPAVTRLSRETAAPAGGGR